MDQSSWLIGPYLVSAYLSPPSSWVFHGTQALIETEWTSPLQLRRRISKISAIVPSLTPSYLYHHQHQESDCKHPRPVAEAGAEATLAAAPPVYCHLPSISKPSQKVSRDEGENLDTKYAQQGLSLLQTSLVHLPQSPSFARQLYIHALVYLLQALPTHLSDPELAGLNAALSRSCLGVVKDGSSRIGSSAAADSQQASSPQDHHRGFETSSPPKQHDYRDDPSTSSSSYLHRTLSTLTSATVRLYRSLLPYFHAFGKTLARCDHEYRIHEHVIAIVLAVVRTIWTYVIVSIDPALVIWCMRESAAGVGEGWKRATMTGKEQGYAGGHEDGTRR
ncbi:MAG: hypothetical protein Q9202_007124 [Teloschistes flavicans]